MPNPEFNIDYLRSQLCEIRRLMGLKESYVINEQGELPIDVYVKGLTYVSLNCGEVPQGLLDIYESTIWEIMRRKEMYCAMNFDLPRVFSKKGVLAV